MLTGETHFQCGDPLLVSESNVDALNPNITDASPAIANGITVSGISPDYNGTTRPNPPAIGAMEFASGTPTVATPVLTPGAGSYGPTQNVVCSVATGGASCIYTTNGSTPIVAALTCTITNGTLYTTSITVASSLTIKAIGCLSGDNASSVLTAAYVINGAVANPTCIPAAGSYSSTQSVTCSSATGGSITVCTIDGSTPTHGSPVCTSISVASSLTLKALSVEAGWSDSSVVSNVYTIAAPANTVINGVIMTGVSIQ